MRHSGNLIRLLLAGAVLCGGWAAYAQVQTKPKSNPAVKKAVPPETKPAPKATTNEKVGTEKPKVKAVPEPAVNSKNEKLPASKDKSAAVEKSKVEQNADEKDAEAEVIHAGAAKFVEAYNAHDAAAVSELFAKKAEFTDEDGNLIQGREAIEANFKQMFEEFPDCKIGIEVDSIRVITPNIALEEGVVLAQSEPDGPEALSSYVAVHVKVNDAWLIGSVSDSEAAPEELLPHDRLQELAWLTGEWLDENPDATIRSSCGWDDSGNYLLLEFAMQLAGVHSANGSMRIGWDPLTRQFKSWTFDADGGYAEGLWTRTDDEWVVKIHGVNAAGEATSAVSVFRYVDDDTMTWRSYDRTVGGLPAESIPENVIKRHPPAPEG